MLKECPRCGVWWSSPSIKNKGKRVCPECRLGVKWDAKLKQWVKNKG